METLLNVHEQKQGD